MYHGSCYGERTDALRALKRPQRASAPMFDTQRYCRDLETAFVKMIEQQQLGQMSR